MENLIYVMILLLMVALVILEGKINKERGISDSELYRIYRLIKKEFNLYADKMRVENNGNIVNIHDELIKELNYHVEFMHQARDKNGKFLPKAKKRKK
jgi:hypothetical protein